MKHDDDIELTRRLDRVEADMRITEAKNNALRSDVKATIERGIRDIILATAVIVGVAATILGVVVSNNAPIIVYTNAPPTAQQPPAQSAAQAAGGATDTTTEN